MKRLKKVLDRMTPPSVEWRENAYDGCVSRHDRREAWGCWRMWALGWPVSRGRSMFA